MRRLVLIVLMLVLPLQWSWAAAASVCEHEESQQQTQTHFGHHEHDHADAADEASPLKGQHLDCGGCHGVGAFCLASLDPAHGQWNGRETRPAYQRHLPEPPIESLLRPPLLLVA